MTTINSTSPLASYLASASKPSSAQAGGQEKAGEGTRDPIAELRKLANLMVARSEGGLLRALNGGDGDSPQVGMNGLAASTGQAQFSGGSSRIQLPDVAGLERDDAAKLLEQVDKLIDSGLGDSIGFAGFRDGEQTDSLATYRDWLQDKGGISIYV